MNEARILELFNAWWKKPITPEEDKLHLTVSALAYRAGYLDALRVVSDKEIGMAKNFGTIEVELKAKMFTREANLAWLMANSTPSDAPDKIELCPDAGFVEFIIGIGDDYMATILINKDAMSALSDILDEQTE